MFTMLPFHNQKKLNDNKTIEIEITDDYKSVITNL